MKKWIGFSVEDEEFELLMDFARHEGFRSFRGFLQSIANEKIRELGNGGYLQYIHRRQAWYRNSMDDYFETKEFCDNWFFDFNKYARSKIVDDEMKLKRY